MFGLRRRRSPSDRGSDRRAWNRHEAVQDVADIEWSQVGKGSRNAAALVHDISLGGVRLLTNQPPTLDQSVWFRLQGTDEPQWLEARVVGVQKVRRRTYQVRLQFLEECPYETFKAAVYGALEVKTDALGSRAKAGPGGWRG